MKLSIVVVNYNVKYFLEQCLHSVYKALQNIEPEIFVVDNNSVDGSCSMIKEKFPQVTLIENKKNVGFSKANNQAIKISRGEYVLLLNPDTVVQEDTFRKCIDFMDNHPDAGALGVKMIDGKGNFLPESKRGLPTPDVAFYKIFGLSRLFPKSKTFGRYHLGYLSSEKTHEVEILAGAYMFLRKSALDKTGLLDEAFFMYGEDIDLSYRIIKAGYKNYYLADTTIIHYKGESTKKGSLNYVLVFYNAMIIFAQKHFTKSNFKKFSSLIHLAIYLRAGLSILKRFIKSTYLPVIDSTIIFTGYLFLKPWSESMKFDEGVHYPAFYIGIIVPLYILFWVLSMLFTGAYDKPIKPSNIIKGIGIGTLLILAIYALLPLDLRFSRLLIILGAVWSIISVLSFRYVLHTLGLKAFRFNSLEKKKIVIAGDEQETIRVKQLLNQTQINPEIIGYISNEVSLSKEYLGNLSQLEDIISIYHVDEIIFCAKDIKSQDIIDHMLNLANANIEFKIAPPESLSIIGSNSINTAGDLYLIDMKSINKPASRREKRLFDIISSLLLLISWPVFVFFIKGKSQSLLNILSVLKGSKTWVSYNTAHKHNDDLPKLKKGILNPSDGLSKKNIPVEMLVRLDFIYAKDYKFTNDLNILLRGLLYIGR